MKYVLRFMFFKLVQLLSTKTVSELSNLGKYLKYATNIKFSWQSSKWFKLFSLAFDCI